MSENESASGFTASGFTGTRDDTAGKIHDAMAVIDAKVIIQLGPTKRDVLIVSDTIAAEMPSEEGRGFLVSSDDMLGLMVRGLVQIGEDLCDHSGTKYSEAMPKLLAEVAARMIQMEYDEQDDVRQAVNLSLRSEDAI